MVSSTGRNGSIPTMSLGLDSLMVAAKEGRGIVSLFRDWHGKLLERHGKALGNVNILGKNFIYVGEADLIQHMFDYPDIFDKSQVFIKDVIEDVFMTHGLASALMPEWKIQQRSISPAFRGSLFAGYQDIVVELTQDILVEQIQQAVHAGETVDMDVLLEQMTSLVLAKSMMNLDGEIVLPQESIRKIVTAVDFVFNYNFARYFAGPLRHVLPFQNKWKKASATALEIGKDAIDRYCKYVEDNQITEGFDIISSMILAGMSYEELVANFLTFTIAGFDTTKSLLKALLYRYVEFPEQSQLQEEIASLPVLDIKTLLGLPILDAFINETLRIDSPSYLMMREVAEDTELGGYPLLAGTTIFFSQHVMHYDSRYWSNPTQFEHGQQAYHSAAYFPFGSGSRKCIGTKFATMEAKIIFATLLKGFDWEIASTGDPVYGALYHRPLSLKFASRMLQSKHHA